VENTNANTISSEPGETCENCPNHWIETYPLVITHGNGKSVVNRVLYLGKTSNEMVDFPAMFDDT
jgi:hypothetical protein